MKKSARNRIIAWSIVSVVLTAVLVLSIICVSKNIGSLNFWNISFTDSDLEKLSKSGDLKIGATELEASKVNSLDINWEAGKVEIINADTDKISISEDVTSNDSEMNMCWYLDNSGELSIYATKKKLSLFNTYKEKTLTVTIPREYKLIDTSVSTASADVVIEEITSNEVDINSASGEVELKVSDAEKVDVENVSGDINVFASNVNKVDIDSISGKTSVDGDYSQLNVTSISGEIAPVVNSANVDIETVSGEVNLKVAEDISGFKVDYESVSGKFNSEFAGGSSDGIFMYGNASSQFDIESVSGSISIEKYSKVG